MCTHGERAHSMKIVGQCSVKIMSTFLFIEWVIILSMNITPVDCATFQYIHYTHTSILRYECARALLSAGCIARIHRFACSDREGFAGEVTRKE